MKRDKSKKHRFIVDRPDKIDEILQKLWTSGCEIVELVSMQTWVGVHYRELVLVDEQPVNKVPEKTVEHIYQKYPRKIGKRQGVLKLKSMIVNGYDANDLEQAVLNFAKSVEHRETKFIPYFSTFMNSYILDFLPENFEQTIEDKRYDFLNDEA